MKPAAILRRRHPGVATIDPHWASTVLLVGFEKSVVAVGAVGDESSYNRTPSYTADLIGSTFATTPSVVKFGSNALRRDVGSTGLLTYPDSADWPSGTNPFTIEAWVRFIGSPSVANNIMFGQYDTGVNQRSWSLNVASNVLQMNLSNNGTAITAAGAGAWTPTLNTWYHLAGDFDGTAYRTYVDGVMKGKTTSVVSLHNATCPVSVGSALNSGAMSSGFDGYLDEVRITAGVARYADDAGFTPPTTAFPRG